MVFAYVMAVVAGVFGVLQAGMNKEIADHLGFTASLLMNSCFFLAVNALFFLFVVIKPKALGSEFAIQWAFENFRWWWAVPGFLGFALVMGLAVGIGRIGATQTFVISIAAQVLASIAWDIWAEGDVQISMLRLVGAGITVIGAVATTLG